MKAGLSSTRIQHAQLLKVHEEIWSRHRLSFRVQALKQLAAGTLDVRETSVRVEVHLPWCSLVLGMLARAVLVLVGDSVYCQSPCESAPIDIRADCLTKDAPGSWQCGRTPRASQMPRCSALDQSTRSGFLFDDNAEEMWEGSAMITRRKLVVSGLAAAVAPSLARAQDAAWPSRNVRIIVPFAPGSSHDVLSRILAEQLRIKFGQNFLIENVSGAGGSMGMSAAARAAPDGYTIGAGTVGTQTINQYLYKSLSYDPERDFEPVSLFWEATNCLFVSAEKNPSRTLAEFITWAKSQPRGVTYGSSGVGTTPHLSGELFRLRTEINARHVAYRDAGQRLLNLVSGELDFAIDSVPNYGALMEQGKVRGLAVTAAKRWPTIPNVPTMQEAGLSDFVVMSWGALVLPAKTPPEIGEKLSKAVREIAADPAFQQRYRTVGALAASSTPAEFGAYASRERKMWADVVKASGAKAE